MSRYLGVFAEFAVVGGYAFWICWRWFQHLNSLAARYDLRERRQRAARRYPVVLLLLIAPLLGVLFSAMSLLGKDHGLLLVLMLAGSLAPASLWWVRQIPRLRALGYGRQHS